MVGLEHPVRANRAASLLTLLEEKGNWSLWAGFWPAVWCNWFVPGVWYPQAVIKCLGARFLFVFVDLVELQHESCDLWLFVVCTSGCHDSAVEDGVKWIVGGAGFWLVSGKC